MTIDPTNPVPPEFPRVAGEDNIPDHVPRELIHSVGIPFGPEFVAAPHEFMARLHETMPPIWYDVSAFGNSWQLIKHADALHMLRHYEVFSNEGATPFPRDPDDYYYFIPIEIDPPDHRKYRAILEPLFSPKGVLQLEDKIRALTNDLIDEVIDKGECEYAGAFGRPLPVSVFLDLMGLPQEKRDTFVTWALDLLHSNDRQTMGQAMNAISSQGSDRREDREPGRSGDQPHYPRRGGRQAHDLAGNFRLCDLSVYRRTRYGLCHPQQHVGLAGSKPGSPPRDD